MTQNTQGITMTPSMEEMTYTRTSATPFDRLVTAVEEAAAKRNFRTLHIHDVKKTLAEKRFEIGNYSIVEVCNSKFAHTVLNVDKTVGMMLPCRIVVYEENGTNRVLLMRPTVMTTMLPGIALGDVPEEVERILIEVVDEAAAKSSDEL